MTKKLLYPRECYDFWDDDIQHAHTQDSIFTVRFTPGFKKEKKYEEFEKLLKEEFSKEYVHKSAIFKEGKKNNYHYHIRIETTLKNKQAVHRKIMSSFKHLPGPAKAVHPCKEGSNQIDDNLGQSKSYCAKDGNLVFSHNIKPEEIKYWIEIGKAAKDFQKKPLYKKIIEYSDFIIADGSWSIPSSHHYEKRSKVMHFQLQAIVQGIEQYYDATGGGYVQKDYRNMQLIKNIYAHLSEDYREFEKERLILSILNQ